jgi:hypothetical protein
LEVYHTCCLLSLILAHRSSWAIEPADRSEFAFLPVFDLDIRSTSHPGSHTLVLLDLFRLLPGIPLSLCLLSGPLSNFILSSQQTWNFGPFSPKHPKHTSIFLFMPPYSLPLTSFNSSLGGYSFFSIYLPDSLGRFHVSAVAVHVYSRKFTNS